MCYNRAVCHQFVMNLFIWIFVSALDIGEIQKVIIEHDGIAERDSWFLKVLLHSFKLLLNWNFCFDVS